MFFLFSCKFSEILKSEYRFFWNWTFLESLEQQWSVPVTCGQHFLSYLRKRAVDFWSSWFFGVTKNNCPSHFTFFKNLSMLTIKGDILLNKRTQTIHIWFIEPWRISWFIKSLFGLLNHEFLTWWNNFYNLYFSLKVYCNCSNTLAFFQVYPC